MRAYVLIFIGLCFFAGQNSAGRAPSDIPESQSIGDESQSNKAVILRDLPREVRHELAVEYGLEPNCEETYENLPLISESTLYREPYIETLETKEVPSLVFITASDPVPKCGGHIIAKYWILAPANCVCHNNNGVKWNPTVNRVLAGSKDFMTPKVTYEIDSVICHQHYGLLPVEDDADSKYANNLALIKLKENVKWSSDLQAIPIDATPSHTLAKSSAVIRFWGSECYLGGSSIFQKTEREVMSTEDCKEAWKENFSIPFRKNILCLKKKSSCAGRLESGATVQDVLIGLPSAEFTWCVRNVVFYTSISYHQHWIENYVKDVEFKTIKPQA